LRGRRSRSRGSRRIQLVVVAGVQSPSCSLTVGRSFGQRYTIAISNSKKAIIITITITNSNSNLIVFIFPSNNSNSKKVVT